MALDPVLNFAKVTVSTGYDASATSIVLSSGHGAKLPQPSDDGAFNLVWWNSSDYASPTDDPNVEIVRCTALATDTLTVTRAQESTTATIKNTGGKTYTMILSITKNTIDGIGKWELPTFDNSSITTNLNAWNKFKPYLQKNTGQLFNVPVVSTYSLVYTYVTAYYGGVLAPNGDIHFVPRYATVGQKISSAGVVSTYSLVYTVANAYIGGVLAPNGDIHFVPYSAIVGQKILSANFGEPFSLGVCLSPYLNKF